MIGNTKTDFRYKSAVQDRRKGGCWPTAEQETLLKAALLPKNEAVEACRQWCSKVNLDQIDAGSQRLLPLLYRNLLAHGVAGPLLGRLKGVYRYTWYQNQMQVRHILPTLRDLDNAGIRTMVLNGLDLICSYYRDFGLQPLSAFDIVVPENQVMAAIDLLTRAGWRALYPGPRAIGTWILLGRNALTFIHPKAGKLDLHWHLIHDCLYPGADEDFWAHRTRANIKGLAVSILNPADQLLYLVVHGVRLNSVRPPIRWLADFAMVIKDRTGDLDWERLLVQTRKRRLILPVKDTCFYVWNVLQVTIPSWVLNALRKMPVSGMERVGYRLRTRPTGLWGFLLSRWFIYWRACRFNVDGASRHDTMGFLTYYQHLWGLEHRHQALFRGIYRLAKRVQTDVPFGD